MAGRLVGITTYDNVPLAEIARLQLEQEGIPVHLENAEVVSALWYAGNAVGYVRLTVPEEHAQQALALLKGNEPPALRQDAADLATDKDICLSCGAPMRDDQASCSACGWSYSDNTDAPSPDNADRPSGPAPARGPLRHVEGSTSHVQGWRRIAIQVWRCAMLGLFLATLSGCVLSMFH